MTGTSVCPPEPTRRVVLRPRRRSRAVKEPCVSEPRVRRAEIAIEQAHVDRVYTRLDELRAQAEAMRTKGYEIGQGAQREAIFEQASMLFERDMMVYHANQTLQSLDAEYEGLVFGRLDQLEREHIHGGRAHGHDHEILHPFLA